MATEDGSARRWSCVACGVAGLQAARGRPRLYCSGRCKPARQEGPRRPRQPAMEAAKCSLCGAKFQRQRNSQPKIYCTEQCRADARQARKPVRPGCQQCGKAIGRKRRGGDPLKFCSRQCAFENWKIAGRGKTVRYSRIYAKNCGLCTRPFVTRKPRARCSPQCDARWALITELRCADPVTCGECGALYCALPGEYARAHCSLECQRLKRARARRSARSKRMAIVRAGRRIDAEAVDPLRVFDECRWRCAICGIRTPRNKRGSYDPDAPELDHIVPLAAGGQHVRSNLQLACRECNRRKGARPLGQLWLTDGGQPAGGGPGTPLGLFGA